MPQKFLEPFRKLPQQLQKSNFMQKLQGLTTGRSTDAFGSYLASTYGSLESPTSMAYDDKLGLLAVGSQLGVIKVYGAPGVVLNVRTGGPGVSHLTFLPEEGRILVSSVDGCLSIYELDPRTGGWFETNRLKITNPEKETITSVVLGHGIIYVGSSLGVLYQVAINKGRLCLGDPTLTSLTTAMVAESLPDDKRIELSSNSSIVALQCQPDGSLLLVAYSGGCVAVVVPQPVPETNGVHTAPVAPETEQVKEVAASQDAEAEATPAEPDAAVADTTATEAPPATPVKGERRATQMFKDITRSLKRLDLGKHETESEPSLPVPPPPRISHILLRDQPVKWATWRLPSTDAPSNEVTVAYGDGAFQVWPICTPMEDDVLKPVIVSMRDPPSTPYGPLPCGAINKIVQSPGVANMLTVFSGGLPRAEFDDRHAVSVLQDSEHHVCFQFGSKVVDFILVPRKSIVTENGTTNETDDQPHVSRPSSPQNASALLVLTERELVAIDLEQPNWPTFASPYLNCLDMSPVTAVAHLTKVSPTLLTSLRDTASRDPNDLISNSQWPIYGGGNCNDLSQNDCNDVVILGHANGWVTLLGLGRGDSLCHLGAFQTSVLFNVADTPKAVEVETWPPFRRVGDCALAEAYSAADPRLAITQIKAYTTDSDSVTLVVGGAGGQVSIWTVVSDGQQSTGRFEPDVARLMLHFTESESSDSIKYIWDGLPTLKPFEGVAQPYERGSAVFRPQALIQCDPPAPITAIALESSWNLLAVGCSLGFAVVDTLTNKVIRTEPMLPQPAEPQAARKHMRNVNVAAVQTALTNRRKQVTAQLRQSFRRLKQLRTPSSTAAPKETGDTPAEDQTTEQPAENQPEPEVAPVTETTSTPETPVEPPTEEPATPAEEPCPESIPAPEPIHLNADNQTAVRCAMFVDTYIISAVPATAQQPAVPSPRTPCLFIGTASGLVLSYTLTWEATSGPVTIQLHKELRLQHRAPVLGLYVMDGNEKCPVMTTSRTRTGSEVEPKPEEPAAETTETTASTEQPPETEAPSEATATTPSQPATPVESHQLLLCTETQVKLFQLPTLRAMHKCKFVDRLRRPGHFGMSASSVGSETAAATTEKTEKKPDTAENETEEEKPAVQASEVDTKSSQTVSQPNRKSIRTFGVQGFTRHMGTEHARTEWNVVVARQDGRMLVLSLPNLRKLFKVKPTFDATAINSLPCVASLLTGANYVFWQCGSQLATYELSSCPNLTSPASVTPGSRATAPSAPITLPEWARPPVAVPVEQPAADEGVALNGAGPDTTEVPLIDESGESVGQVVNGAAELQVADSTELVHPLPEKYNPTAALHAGDVTIDSIKEYLNGEGTVTIKTVETSTEKRTLVEGGHVVTTLRETECVDGQVTKDDLVKFSTEDSAASPPQSVVESS